MDYKSNRNVVHSCKYYVVWCPKYRRRALVEGIDERLRVILREVSVQACSEILEMEAMPDHVHMLVEVDPQFGIRSPIKRMKGRSSRLMRQEFPNLKSRLPTLWTNSYFISRPGGAPPAMVKQYIAGSGANPGDHPKDLSLPS
jgi:putative transposase